MVLDVVLSSADVLLADNLDKVGPSSLHVLELCIMCNFSGLCEGECRSRLGFSGPVGS